MGRIKLACWNIGSALQNLDCHIEMVKEVLKKYSPDIICFQEFPDSDRIINEILEIGKFEKGIFLKTSESHVSKGWNMGICIFSKISLGELKSVELPKPKERIYYNGAEETWHSKYFVATSVKINETKIDLISGHSFPFYRYALKESEHSEIYRFIDDWVKNNVSNTKYIIAADFNANNAVEFMPFIQQDHFDVFEGVATRPSGRKTDAVIVHRSTQVNESVNENFGFDHHYLMVEMEF